MKSTSQNGIPISARRQRVFQVVVLLIPIIALLGLEVGLRFGSYGGNLDLIVRKSYGTKEFYAVNRDVGRKYFGRSVSSVPEPTDDVFELKKQRNTRRIFCLGESTMAGYPYEFHSTAPGFLQDRLQAMLPGYTIEVINLGISAVSSYVVDDFIDQLSAYEPDLFVIYLGHNEFYGIYGAGSAVGSQRSVWLTRLNISLLNFKTFLLLRDMYSWLLQQMGSGEKKSGSLMGQMVGEQEIALTSETYSAAKTAYQENLRSIIERARKHGVPLMFSSLVSNLRTQKPFVSLHAPGLSEEQLDRWNSLQAHGDSLERIGDDVGALEAFKEATAIDSVHAEGAYNYGRLLFTRGHFEDAKDMFGRAKDLDALRFRASTEFEDILKEVCRSTGTPLSPVDSLFRTSSPHGIIGSELILEHLHPNIRGYFLMAKSFSETVRAQRLLVPDEVWNTVQEPSDEELMSRSTVSEFDRQVGDIKVTLLMRRWPFTTDPTDYKFTPAGPVEGLVFQYLQGKLPWSDARYRLAEYYAGKSEWELARNECLAVGKVLFYSYQPFLRYADYFRLEGKRKEAIDALRICTSVEDNPFSRLKIALLLVEEDPAEAAREIETALEVEKAGIHKLNLDAAASARYLLAVAYAKQGKTEQARTAARYALALKPSYAEAEDLLRQLGGR